MSITTVSAMSGRCGFGLLWFNVCLCSESCDKEWIHGLSAQMKAEAAVLKAAGSAEPGLALPPGAKTFPLKPPNERISQTLRGQIAQGRVLKSLEYICIFI